MMGAFQNVTRITFIFGWMEGESKLKAKATSKQLQKQVGHSHLALK